MPGKIHLGWYWLLNCNLQGIRISPSTIRIFSKLHFMPECCNVICRKSQGKANFYISARPATAAGAILSTLSPYRKPSQGFKAREIKAYERDLPKQYKTKQYTNGENKSTILRFLEDIFWSVCAIFLQEKFNIYRWRNSGLLVFLGSFLTCPHFFFAHLLPRCVAFQPKCPWQPPVWDPGLILHRRNKANLGDSRRNALITRSQHPALPAAGGNSSLC